MVDEDPASAIRHAQRAYTVGSEPAAQREFYDGWATTYDIDFARDGGYIYPAQVAEVLVDEAGDDDRPIADIGCGTGLVGVALHARGVIADGFDLSEQMLAVARGKEVYRDLFVADLTASHPPATGYGALVSCGTFTVGHLGPQVLGESLRMVRPGGLCVIGVTERHYWDAGFDVALQQWEIEGRIHDRRDRMVPVYAAGEGVEVSIARVLVFRLKL